MQVERQRDRLMTTVWPEATRVRLVLVALSWSLLIGASARVAVSLPFSPVPLTLQTLSILLAGAALGPRLGLLAIGTYLLEGIAGLPVFAEGTSGLAVLLGPTGGYLAGFALAVVVVGLLADRGWGRSPLLMLGAMLLGNIAIYACGVGWLAHFVGLAKAVPLGLLPFVPGDLLKSGAAAAVFPAAYRLTRGRA